MSNRPEYPISAQDRKDRIESSYTPAVYRSWREVSYKLQLHNKSEAYWKGKQILDIGSGKKRDNPSDVFPGATVYAIDPYFPVTDDLIPQGFATSDEEAQILAVNTADVKRVGIAQEIPFDSNMFHQVISTHTIPQHIFPIEMAKAVSEMLRVLKPEGQIRLNPCVPNDLSLEKDALEKAGFNIIYPLHGLAVIQADEFIRNSTDPLEQQVAYITAWRQFHQAVLPNDKLRSDLGFDVRAMALHRLQK